LRVFIGFLERKLGNRWGRVRRKRRVEGMLWVERSYDFYVYLSVKK
jgi:hypothetical protein